MKIPLKDAISTGDWFSCCYLGINQEFEREEMNFRFRVLSMELVDIKDIDNPRRMKIDHGVLYLLSIDVVNMNKQLVRPHNIRESIILIDQDGFSFKAAIDDHLTNNSKFATIKGLNRFVGWGDCPDLAPKIKTSGALAYLLPDDDTAQYFLSVEKGTIKAV